MICLFRKLYTLKLQVLCYLTLKFRVSFRNEARFDTDLYKEISGDITRDVATHTPKYVYIQRGSKVTLYGLSLNLPVSNDFCCSRCICRC